MMGIVSQDAILFNDSVFTTFAWEKIKQLKEVIAAAKTANAHEFIMQMQEGYNSKIGEEEINFLGTKTTT